MKAVVTLCLLLGALGAPSLGVPSAKSFGFSWPWTDVNKFAAENVQFELYTRENPESPERTRVCDLPVTLQYLVSSRPTKILIHGWGGVFQGVIDIKDAFLAKDDMNVVVVDWNEVDTFLYPVAAQRTKVVARQVGAFINFLVDTEEGPGLNLSDLHLVGHSLGAHIAGMSSLYVDGIIGRITGLDPASPLIADDPTSRLDKSDAAFVDVIHTSTNLFGWLAPLGHVDFYPNNGVAFQPNCMADDLKSAKCSHNFGYPLFNESILVDDAFLAQPAREPATYNLLTSPCKDQDIEGTPIFMGLSTPTSARGVYCLATRGESPYGYGPLAVLSSNFEATDLEIRAMKSLLSIG